MIRPVLAEIAGSWPSALQFGADVGGAAVLPDDGAVHGLAGGAVPHHGGLALVGDADRGDVLRLQAGFLQRVAARP